MNGTRWIALAALAFAGRAFAFAGTAFSQDSSATPFVPHVEPASDEARAAMAGFKVPAGFKIELFAAEPLLANPVCFAFDMNGRDVYVGETFRHHKGVTDIRDHMDWNDDDLAARTVEDRVAYFKKHLGDKFPEFERACERVRLIRDTDGDGVADTASVFADQFHSAADGIGASLLAYRGDVLYTCIPSLWLLHDADGDGAAEVQRELSTGYGVHVALLGHDLHGLRIGPDGKLYFSIGDRGFNVPVPTGRIEHPETGAVFRSNLDGSDLEVFALGLRNPQDLVFDAYGNLFTGDNNSDGGDKARLVQVVEGSDTGWRQAFQWITEPNMRGPWNDEKLWVPHFDGQAAYVLPPIENLCDGPSGITINPGTGFPASYDGAFFLCDFRGGASYSGVRSFKLEPRGAGFALDSSEEFFWGSLATDCDVGPDGALYVLDWVEGWNQTGKGRIYRAFDPTARDAPAAVETRKLLAEGFDRRPESELAQLLAHADQRVRQEAQFVLVVRGEAGQRTLAQIAANTAESQLARIHAIWGLGMCARRGESTSAGLVRDLLTDKDAEVRAQSARVLGDLRERFSRGALARCLRDVSPRVRMYAAIGLGRLRSSRRRDSDAPEALLELAREIGESDPVLRHAVIFGLAGCATPELLAAMASDPSVDVRIAAVVALRRMRAPEVARFLADAEPRVQLEAARAIYDTPLSDALPELADRIEDTTLSNYALLRRVVNANFRIGTPAAMRALAALALRDAVDEKLRVEALERLAQWKDPPPRDPVVGEWRQLLARETAGLIEVVLALDRGGITSASAPIVRAWIELCEAHRVFEASNRLAELALDRTRAAEVRARAVEALIALDASSLAATVRSALSDVDGSVRAAALSAAQSLPADEAYALCSSVLASGELSEQRTALRVLAKVRDPRANELFARELDRHAAGRFPSELALDLVLASEARHDKAIDERLASMRRPRADDPEVAPFLDGLSGGDASAGRKIFREKAELACLRCHKIEDGEGGEVGPDLRGLAKRRSALATLEAICVPNREIAAEFRSTLVFLKDDSRLDGRVLSDDGKTLRLIDAQAEIHEVPLSEVESRREGLSAMPEGLAAHLSRESMRDLLAYLRTL